MVIKLPITGPKEFKAVSVSPNPYKGGEEQIIIWHSADGIEAWTDAGTGRLIQAGPSAGQQNKKKELPTVPELRSIANAALEKLIPDFSKRRKSLHPLEDHKDKEIYFFRWDDFSRPTKDNEMPPFVQVALSADGKLVSFTDTLTR